MNQPSSSLSTGAIGVFDSGYGGLTILDKIREFMPEYDYIYLGDNARTPYGTRSFEVVYEFTLQAVNKLLHWVAHWLYWLVTLRQPKHSAPTNSWTYPNQMTLPAAYSEWYALLPNA